MALSQIKQKKTLSPAQKPYFNHYLTRIQIHWGLATGFSTIVSLFYGL